MEEKLLRPRKDRVELNGKITYRQNARSWSAIQLGKEIIQEFPQLKEKNSRFGFKIEFYFDKKDFNKKTKRLIRDNEALPVLLWFYKRV